MESPIAYIPMDRRQALARGAELPEHSSGAALFADISGFTPLTEALVRVLGPQRGTEELPRRLNQVYDALIAEVDRYGGAVLGFAGDAITCWFDDAPHGDGPARAAACAIAIQQAMEPFRVVEVPGAGSISLAIKVGLASGSVRRFVVGDPTIQIMDVLAGDTIQRMAGAEHMAQRGEVLIDAETAAALGERAEIGEWRTDPDEGWRFGVLRSLRGEVAATPWPALPETALDEASYRPWLLPPVFERLRAGMGAFLTELRPVAVLFVRFGGIDYDHDPQAQEKLNSFILWAQRILQSYDGYILQLTVGDKGSFFYSALGAPSAHEDDPVRAVMAALELCKPHMPYLQPVQIGLSYGRSRTGAYGAVTRRTYGVLGDDVNMAARLMQNAGPGQVIISQELRRITGNRFTWERRAPITVKGKSELVTTYRLIGVDRSSVRLHEPRYALPMVGRRTELAFVLGRLALAQQGQGQIIGVVAEAGMGKSRLVAEAVRAAWARDLSVYGGECQSYGTNTPYLPWQSIWRGFFGLEPTAGPEEQAAALQVALARIDPALLPRLPLLGAVLNLPIPDNDLTRSFDARLRKESLEALLVSCLRARAAEAPVLLVVEDCHWLDALSHDLLEVIGRAGAGMALLVLLAYRPAQAQHLLTARVTELPHFRALALDSLLPQEVEQLVRLKLGQFLGDIAGAPPELVEQINARTQGNPFYVEELLNYMRDRGVDPRSPQALSGLDLPASLHSLILSRIDRLTESQKSLIKVASVIGRLFPAAILWGVAAFFGQQNRVRRELEELSSLELTPLDTPEPELTYLFKHIVTQEVAYESLPYATRAALHEQIGQHLEQRSAGQDQLIDLLAFHYDRSENMAKRREYLLRAGASAQAIYANSAAIDYYGRLLALLPEPDQTDVLLRLGDVLTVVGRWDEAYARYQAALGHALAREDLGVAATARALIGELLRKQGRFAEAKTWLAQALELFEALADQPGLADALNYAGTVAMHTGDYELARARYEASLAIQRERGNLLMVGKALSNLGIVAFYQGDEELAWRRFEESLAVRREAGDSLWIANSLGNLGMISIETGNYERARDYIEESLALERAAGDRAAIAISLNNLGKVVCAAGDYARARALYGEALRINRELDDRWALPYLLEDIAVLAALTAQPERALRLAEAAAAVRDATTSPLAPSEQARLDEALAPARAELSADEQAAARSQGRAMEPEQAVAEALRV